MTNLVAKTANIALIALGALPIIAVSLAHAEPATIRVSDLNMSRPADVRTFDARVDRAADQVCGDTRDLDRLAACRAGVRAEALSKLPVEARASGPSHG